MNRVIVNLIALLSLIITFVKTQGTCSLGLECNKTFCCKNSICVDSSVCKNDMNVVYIVVGCTAIFLLILTVIYYLISRKETIESMKKYNEANNNRKPLSQQSSIKQQKAEN